MEKKASGIQNIDDSRLGSYEKKAPLCSTSGTPVFGM